MSKRKKYTIIGLIVAAIVGFIAFHQIEAASPTRLNFASYVTTCSQSTTLIQKEIC